MTAKYSRFLIPEQPLYLLPTLAIKVGLPEAVILQQIHFWCNSPTARERDGYTWVYNSYTDWQKHFPFLSSQQIGRAIRHLEAEGYLISDNFNARAIDRTKWYRIDHAKLDGDLDDDHPPTDYGRSNLNNGGSALDDGDSILNDDGSPVNDQRIKTEHSSISKDNPKRTPETSAERETDGADAPFSLSLLEPFTKGFKALRAIPDYASPIHEEVGHAGWMTENGIDPGMFQRAATAAAADWPPKKGKLNPLLHVRKYCLNQKKWAEEAPPAGSRARGVSVPNHLNPHYLAAKEKQRRQAERLEA